MNRLSFTKQAQIRLSGWDAARVQSPEIQRRGAFRLAFLSARISQCATQMHDRQFRLRGRGSLYALQFLQHSPNLARHSRDGSGNRGSCLDNEEVLDYFKKASKNGA